MDFAQFVDLFLHLDRHLANVVELYGTWVYAMMFAIVFVETGLVVMPFLPGDSLLFVAGAIAGLGAMNLPTLVVLLAVAAIAGDAVNYSIGRAVGPRVFSWEQSRFFDRAAFDRAHAFYEEYGGITIVVARFLPFVRTFAPFVAGVAQMTYSRFAMYNVTGGVLWVGGLTVLGYVFGNMQWVKDNFQWVALALVVVPGLPAVFEVLRRWRVRNSKARGG
jgi:membrane-associated protein